MEIIKNSHELPRLIAVVKTRLKSDDLNTLEYLLRYKDGTRNAISVKNDARLYGVSENANTHTRVQNAINRYCLELGIEPPAFVPKDRTTVASFTGRVVLYILTNPETGLDTAMDAVATENFIRYGETPEEGTKLRAEACILALEAMRSRDIDGFDPFIMEGESKERYALISGLSYSADTVMINPIPHHTPPAETDEHGQDVEAYEPDCSLELLLRDYPEYHRLTEGIIDYMMADTDNLTDEQWKAIEQDKGREFIKELGQVLYEPGMDATKLRKLELILNTAGIKLPRLKDAPVALIRDGRVHAYRW